MKDRKYAIKWNRRIEKKHTLKTPAKVRTNPLAAPTKNTAATFNRNATEALLTRMPTPRSFSS